MLRREDAGRFVVGTILIGVYRPEGIDTDIEHRYRMDRVARKGESFECGLTDLVNGDRIACFAHPSGPNLVFYRAGVRMEELWHEDARLAGRASGLGEHLV